MTSTSSRADAAEALRAGHAYVDIVDFVERTTYAIWNGRRPDLIAGCYGPRSVIWSDSGASFGDAVISNSAAVQTAFPDLRGVIPGLIWTGDDVAGYRTSMRWQSQGTNTGPGLVGEPTGRVVHNTAISNCVVLGDQYIEEWEATDHRYFAEQLGLDIDAAVRLLHEPAGSSAEQHTRSQQDGARVPVIPARVDGAGEFVLDLLDGLYNRRDLSLVERRYAAGAPYQFGASRWNVGHRQISDEIGRRLRQLPDLALHVEELYWLDDAPNRSRVAVRYTLSAMAHVHGEARPVSLLGIHHIHVRGDLVVAEWAELDELALYAQLLPPDQSAPSAQSEF